MQIQTPLLAAALLAGLALGSAHAQQAPQTTASNPATQRTGTPTNPPTSTPTWTVPGTKATKQAQATATRPKCPDGTYWYEPAKNCVPVGGHPAERTGLGGGKPKPRPPSNCTFPPCPGEERKD
ncbi:hypothetical protein [Thermomonas flagellata]|uniref:hypothetical protein n=1 Tax=Thermomonas flagellata TaxID=2888524 RepID=UPI001F03D649|nr:hypothetical protein [Thermomonas flagellata]